MTRISICTFILMIAFLWNSCSGKPTAIDQLKSDYKNPIDAMRLPEQPDRKKREVPRSDEPQAISKETQRGIDLSPLSKEKKSAIEHLVVVTKKRCLSIKAWPKIQANCFCIRESEIQIATHSSRRGFRYFLVPHQGQK